MEALKLQEYWEYESNTTSAEAQKVLDKVTQFAKNLTPVNNNHELSPEEQEIEPGEHK